MTNQEILEKAIAKAIEGGWKAYLGTLIPKEILDFYSFQGNHFYELFIFDHNFAKALWGEEPTHDVLEPQNLPNWQYHLQQMVIAEDPIKYLGDNI